MKFFPESVKGILIASALSNAPASAATDANFASKVSRAKKSLYESADTAFVKSMTEKGADIIQAGISPSQVRDASKWGVLGFSLGVCSATNTQLAYWFGAFDKLSISRDSSGSAVVKMFYDIGSSALSEGKLYGTLSRLTRAEKKEFCRVEMAAVNELIGEFQ